MYGILAQNLRLLRRRSRRPASRDTSPSLDVVHRTYISQIEQGKSSAAPAHPCARGPLSVVLTSAALGLPARHISPSVDVTSPSTTSHPTGISPQGLGFPIRRLTSFTAKNSPTPSASPSPSSCVRRTARWTRTRYRLCWVLKIGTEPNSRARDLHQWIASFLCRMSYSDGIGVVTEEDQNGM